MVLPSERANRGEFTLADLKKQGSGYVGTVNAGFMCFWKGFWKIPRDNSCQNTDQLEITSFTTERIEGWSFEIVEYDCEKCRVKKRERTKFVWIPY